MSETTQVKALSYGVDASYHAPSQTWQFKAGDQHIGIDREELVRLVAADALAAAQADAARLRGVIERDRTGYSRMVSSLRAHVMRWSGIASSRGPYEWDDEEYFQEFGRCLKELAVIADRGEKATHATDWTDCPKSQTAVDAARRELAQEAGK